MNTYDYDIPNAHDDSHMTEAQMDEARRDMALYGAMREAAMGIIERPSMLTKELVEAVLYAQSMNKMANEALEAALEKERAIYDKMVAVLDPWDGAYPAGPRP